jgi:hypothetical protein
MKLSIKVASTSQTVNVFIQDSSSTTGAGLTGLVFNTASLTAYYALPKAAAVSITLATLAAVTSAYSSGGFKEIDATNMPGWYRFDIPDAALASGRFVSLHLKGATNMAPLPLEIELTGWDNQSATDGGLSKLTSLTFTGANKVDASMRDCGGTTVTARDIGASVLLSAGTGTGQLDFTSGVVKANLAQILGTALTETAGLLAGGFKKFFNIASPVSTMDVLARVTLTDTVTTYTGNTPQTGDSFARLGAPAGASHAVDTAAVKTDTAAIKLKTDNLPAIPAAVGSAMTLTSGERDSTADALLARNVAGGSSAGRLVKEALYVLRNKTDIQSGTLTVYGTDDTTSAFTAAVTTAAGNPITTVDPA